MTAAPDGGGGPAEKARTQGSSSLPERCEAPAAGGIPAAALKSRLADELAMLARDMEAFQATLSTVLETGELSSEQLRRLQDLDRATQMLDNLHRVATALAAAHPHHVPASDLEALVTLNDLRIRLSGAAHGETAAAEDDDVAWL